MGLKIRYDDALIPTDKILSTAENIMPEINRARSIISSGYGKFASGFQNGRLRPYRNLSLASYSRK